MKSIDEKEGRTLFGLNVAGYDDARPPYPIWMFDALVSQKAVFVGAATLEIGAGNGLATGQLVQCGVSPLTLLEPDERFAPLLWSIVKNTREVRILHESFEAASFAPSSFDLVVSATAFHWLDATTRVQKLANIVRPNGYVALLWNVFQDLNLVDPFHEASKSLLAPLSASPSGKPDGLPFALDRSAREQEFLQGGNFELAMYAESHWQLKLTTARLRKLYEGFSSLARLTDKERHHLLDALVDIAETKFSGEVTRNMTSPLYLFRRT